MSQRNHYRPVVVNYPHDVGMRPMSGDDAYAAYVAQLDSTPPETLIAAAEQVCTLVSEDFTVDDATADRIFRRDGIDVAAAAAVPEIVDEIRGWVLRGIAAACWEDRRTVGPLLVVTNNVQHIGGHPYSIVVTPDDIDDSGVLILNELLRGCLICNPASGWVQSPEPCMSTT